MSRGSVSQNYSTFNPVVLEKEKRLEKAQRIISILKSELKGKFDLNVLDVGCSSGIITNELAKHFHFVLGIDVDIKAINDARDKFKRKNLKFEERDATKTKYREGSFDVIVANQIYYCFPHPETFFNEMSRILKPGGIMFLGARNKYTFWDAQYHLPLLAFMPKNLSSMIVKAFGRSDRFDAQYRSYWELKRLVKTFLLRSYSHKVVQSYHKIMKFIPESILKLLEPIYPNFIWILKKKEVS